MWFRITISGSVKGEWKTEKKKIIPKINQTSTRWEKSISVINWNSTWVTNEILI